MRKRGYLLKAWEIVILFKYCWKCVRKNISRERSYMLHVQKKITFIIDG